LSRDSYEAWQAAGLDIEERCRRKAGELLETYRPKRLPARVEQELERILRREVGPEFHFEEIGGNG
jgi:trimethylamine:corrinoid methyltransferase-like protein